jgi:hypothetical protein
VSRSTTSSTPASAKYVQGESNSRRSTKPPSSARSNAAG